MVEGAFGLKRGDIWTVSGGADYTGKPRPAIIIQSDTFDSTLSITVCPLTGTLVDAAPARFPIAPSGLNGLQTISHAMVDKIATLPKSKVGRRLGALTAAEVALLNQTIALFLGLADEQSSA
jgi:mRNA interferase MazF